MDRIAMLQDILSKPRTMPLPVMAWRSNTQIPARPIKLSIILKIAGEASDYTAGYFMAANARESGKAIHEAKKMLDDGIASAKRTGNAHALSEMQDMLRERCDNHS